MKSLSIDDFKLTGGLRTLRDGLPDDLFLVCSSYEPRALAVVDSFSVEYRARWGLIYVNKEVLEDTKSRDAETNLARLKESLDSHCDSVTQVIGSWRDPLVQMTELRKALFAQATEPPSPTVITLDTTTFNREALLTSVALLRSRFPSSTIRALYTSPVQHGEWLSQGFRCVRNVMSFAGIQQPSLPTVLVVLSGFEPERTIKLIEEHEPSKVLLGIGDPPTNQAFLERNVNEQKLILARQEVERFVFPANGIRQCWDTLEELLKPYWGNFNVVLAPMSTKLSTLAVFLTARRHPDLQVTYCVPGDYNSEDYSRGISGVFVDELPNEPESISS